MEKKMDAEVLDGHIARVEELILELSRELELLEPEYIGGEVWDDGYRFTADSISPLRELLEQQARPASGAEPSLLSHKDLSGCINASRIRHQTEWVLKKKMPAKDSHVLMCISFCDGAIPEPPDPYSGTSPVHPDIESIDLP